MNRFNQHGTVVVRLGTVYVFIKHYSSYTHNVTKVNKKKKTSITPFIFVNGAISWTRNVSACQTNWWIQAWGPFVYYIFKGVKHDTRLWNVFILLTTSNTKWNEKKAHRGISSNSAALIHPCRLLFSQIKVCYMHSPTIPYIPYHTNA